ncbi:MAG: hydroxymethylbilane synthase [Gammaproteobacteria bacterium]|nr:hydroxymethylbilane synthase [Gammaproteobacteria bacterium]
MKLTIATRQSALALKQAYLLQDAIKESGYESDILGLTTRGDQLLEPSLFSQGGKGLFIKELEVALLEGRAQLAIHSAKDVPSILDSAFAIQVVLPREDVRDVWISHRYPSLQEVPLGARIGTTSPRRKMLLTQFRPDLNIVPLRGNINSRINKAEQFDGIILANAGIRRLSLTHLVSEILPLEWMLPAPGQGALIVECLQSTPSWLHELILHLQDMPTHLAVTAERTLATYLETSCHSALAAHAHFRHSSCLQLQVKWQPHGLTNIYTHTHESTVENVQQAVDLGKTVAVQLLEKIT